MDLRNWYDRNRWNRICDRWLIFVLAMLYIPAVGVCAPTINEWVLWVIMPVPMLGVTAIFSLVIWQCAKGLINWLKGY